MSHWLNIAGFECCARIWNTWIRAETQPISHWVSLNIYPGILSIPVLHIASTFLLYNKQTCPGEWQGDREGEHPTSVMFRQTQRVEKYSKKIYVVLFLSQHSVGTGHWLKIIGMRIFPQTEITRISQRRFMHQGLCPARPTETGKRASKWSLGDGHTQAHSAQPLSHAVFTLRDWWG